VSLLSATVVGPDLGLADAYATTLFVMGSGGLEWVHDHPGYGAFVVTCDEIAVSTPVFDALRAPA
jgi:thiamine biosynthesis lipoprotein